MTWSFFFFFLPRQLRELRSSSVTGRGSARGSVGSLSPVLSSSGSANPVSRPSAGLKRRPASFHARTPRTPRPNELKITPINRMLNTPTSVDSIPRLRRFTSSQTHTSSFAYMSPDEGSRNSKSLETKESKEDTKGKEEVAGKNCAGTPQPPAVREKEEGSAEPEDSRRRNEHSRTPEVLCQPTSEIQGDKHPQEKRELVKVTLSGLWTPESQAQETTGETGEDQKMCCGFFFKVSCSFIDFIKCNTRLQPAVALLTRSLLVCCLNVRMLYPGEIIFSG